MKIVGSLAILVAALLLLTNMVFACDQVLCYQINSTDENGNTNSDFWFVCLENDGTGVLSTCYDGYYDLSLFGTGPGTTDTTGGPLPTHLWSTWVARLVGDGGSAAFIRALPPAPAAYTVTGGGVYDGTRYVMQGVQIPCSEAISECYIP